MQSQKGFIQLIPLVAITFLFIGVFLSFTSVEKKTSEVSPTPEATQSPVPSESPSPTPTPTPTKTPTPTLTPTPTSKVSTNNTAPASGYSSQYVQTTKGNFLVNMVAADIGSTRVLVDTASASDCSSNCPVLPLSDYVARNGGFAGVNGTYFCPQDYASCAGKENTFDLLVMNKDKTYFNSDNNVYSNNPAVIFGNGYVRFVTSASQWGRDTSPNGVISNFPLLVFNSNITFGGDSDAKQSAKGNRSFVANKGNTIYIGVVRNVTVAESAMVLHALGMDNAMNLDDGGSTALWDGGYKAGPGRNIPNAIIFAH